jgi:hypothetical protein
MPTSEAGTIKYLVILMKPDTPGHKNNHLSHKLSIEAWALASLSAATKLQRYQETLAPRCSIRAWQK